MADEEKSEEILSGCIAFPRPKPLLCKVASWSMLDWSPILSCRFTGEAGIPTLETSPGKVSILHGCHS